MAMGVAFHALCACTFNDAAGAFGVCAVLEGDFGREVQPPPGHCMRLRVEGERWLVRGEQDACEAPPARGVACLVLREGEAFTVFAARGATLDGGVYYSEAPIDAAGCPLGCEN